MKMDLETLAKIVEEQVPTARATCVPEVNQIIVAFMNRPDVEVALLTPYYQSSIKAGSLDVADIDDLVESVRMLVSPVM